MTKALRIAALLMLAALPARAGGIPLFTGPQDPSQIFNYLNTLIGQINNQILASGTGSLAAALSITGNGAVAGNDDPLIITPGLPGSGLLTLQAGGVDANVSMLLQTQGTGDIKLSFPSTGALSFPAGSMSVVPTGHAPMTLGNALYGYGPMGVAGPPVAFVQIKFAGIGGTTVPGFIPVWTQQQYTGLLQ